MPAPQSAPPEHVPRDLRGRILCFLCCLPSCFALPLDVYGVAPLREFTLLAILPGFATLALVYRSRRGSPLADDLRLGLLVGLFATVLYDLARLPWHLSGIRVFAPISAYGLWLTGAGASDRFTELAGWAFHFSNGVAFATMYCLWMAGRPWILGVLWGLVLESIFLATPFATLFGLAGNWAGIGIAYWGHVAWGAAVGLAMQRRQETLARLAGVPPVAWWVVGLAAGAMLLGPASSESVAARDSRGRPGRFLVEGPRLNPDWLRVPPGGSVTVLNPGDAPAEVRCPLQGRAILLAPGETGRFDFPDDGLFQMYVFTGRRTISSFVLVEP